MNLSGLGTAVIGALLFLNARKVAGMKRFMTGRENKYEYGYYLSLKLFSPLVVLYGVAAFFGWVPF